MKSLSITSFKILMVIAFIIHNCAGDKFYDMVIEEWNLFKVKYNKPYNATIEESYRFKIFMYNLKKIHSHNRDYYSGKKTFKMAVNQYTDMFHSEIKKTLCGINGTLLSEQLEFQLYESFVFLPPANIQVPDEVNWVNKGAVTEVKNQGQCGSCWAFSTTGSLEGQHFRSKNELISLSEQNLVDCSNAYGNEGCSGGLMSNAFKYIHDNHGIDTEKSYPYLGYETNTCKFKRSKTGATCKGYTFIEQYNENALKIAVATIGPISVGIEASDAFMSYSDGVFYDPDCAEEPDDINHGVLIVGYGHDKESNMDYWLVKNSWGQHWGLKGYIKMARNKNNNCNIASYALYPLV